ncbi:MAG: hypothetical protein WBD63_05595 [Phycisphaerae bacterium]|nr:hypothetical protein [Phycisphaerae bacterium]
MRVMMNGQEFHVPTERDGSIRAEELRRAGGIPSSRTLILQQRDGGNEVLGPGQRVLVKPGEHFSDAPQTRRGR